MENPLSLVVRKQQCIGQTMQQNSVAGAQLNDNGLDAPVGPLAKANLCVVLYLDDATNLLLLAHQLSGQCELRVLSGAQSKPTTPLKDLPAPHRHGGLVRIGGKEALRAANMTHTHFSFMESLLIESID